MEGDNSGLKTLNGKIVLQVYLLDNSYKTLLVEPDDTVHDVCRSMAEKIGFSDPEDDSLCFGLHECYDKVTIQRALPPETAISTILGKWSEYPDARVIYKVKLFTDSIVNSVDPKVIHMLFIEAVYNVITGIYPTSEKDAVHLAALAFSAKFGQHNKETHKPGFLRNSIVEYIPATHLEASGPTGPKTVEEWEADIFHKHAYIFENDPRQAYLNFLKKRESYGAIFFAVKQRFSRSLPKKLFLAISAKGIMLIRIPRTYTEEDLEVFATYRLADIYRWAYKPSVNFYFEVKLDNTDINPVYTFESPEGKIMSDMLTDYAMALLREMGLNPDGTRRVRNTERQGINASAQPLPVKSAMATTEDAYNTVGGEVGSLASAAIRSGEYGDEESGSAPPPPPEMEPPNPPVESETEPEPESVQATEPVVEEKSEGTAEEQTEEDEKDLPPNWMKVFDDGSGEYYYFNTATSQSVWERHEITE